MDYWIEQADRLNEALLANPQALVLHFLYTAPPEELERLAGDALPQDSKTRASVAATLASRLAAAAKR